MSKLHFGRSRKAIGGRPRIPAWDFAGLDLLRCGYRTSCQRCLDNGRPLRHTTGCFRIADQLTIIRSHFRCQGAADWKPLLASHNRAWRLTQVRCQRNPECFWWPSQHQGSGQSECGPGSDSDSGQALCKRRGPQELKSRWNIVRERI